MDIGNTPALSEFEQLDSHVWPQMNIRDRGLGVCDSSRPRGEERGKESWEGVPGPSPFRWRPCTSREIPPLHGEEFGLFICAVGIRLDHWGENRAAHGSHRDLLLVRAHTFP